MRFIARSRWLVFSPFLCPIFTFIRQSIHAISISHSLFLLLCFTGFMGATEKWRERIGITHRGEANIFRRSKVLSRLPISKQLATENCISTKNRRSDVRVSGWLASTFASLSTPTTYSIFTKYSLFSQFSFSPPLDKHIAAKIYPLQR